MNNIYNLLELESKEIEHLFKKASIEGQGTPQEVADRREVAVKKFLEKYFPFPFRVAKGNINDSFGKRSASIDCLVLNPSHPYTVSDDEKYSVILADGVDFAIEVKPDLSKKSEIERALKQIHSVKSLTRAGDGILLRRGYSEKKLLNAKKIPSFIFANKAHSDISILAEHIVSYYESNNVPRLEQFDCIIINGRGILLNYRKDSYIDTSDTAEAEGLYYNELEHKTIINFLYLLNVTTLSSPKMSESVLSHYLEFDMKNAKHNMALNKRLIALG